jgi:glycine/D-amino acid oxidase-like deaminating enzyme
LFHRTGVLWLARASDAYNQHNLEIFQKLGVPHERVSRTELEKRYPQIALGPVTWGLLETESGVLMARRAVQAVVEEAVKKGVDYVPAAALIASARGKLSSLTTTGGAVRAETFVFACGPWLPKLFPALLGECIFPTQQEVYFFGVPAGDHRFAPPAMPTWISLGDEFYGTPDLESRDFKAALDRAICWPSAFRSLRREETSSDDPIGGCARSDEAGLPNACGMQRNRIRRILPRLSVQPREPARTDQ